MDKRLMKLAGLLKENFDLPDDSPFESDFPRDNIIEAVVDSNVKAYIKHYPNATAHAIFVQVRKDISSEIAKIAQIDDWDEFPEGTHDKIDKMVAAALTKYGKPTSITEDFELPDESPFEYKQISTNEYVVIKTVVERKSPRFSQVIRVREASVEKGNIKDAANLQYDEWITEMAGEGERSWRQAEEWVNMWDEGDDYLAVSVEYNDYHKEVNHFISPEYEDVDGLVRLVSTKEDLSFDDVRVYLP